MAHKFEDMSGLIEHFRLRSHRKARAHYLASKSSFKKHIWVGVPIIVITTVVGSGVILNLIEGYAPTGPLVIGGLSLVAAVLSTFQTFFGYSENAAKHKNAGNQYSSLYRRLAIITTQLATSGFDQSKISGELEQIRAAWDAIELEAPDVADELYDLAKTEQADDGDGV